MIPIHRQGNKLPLFVVHTSPKSIKRKLGRDRPIYFFRALWDDGRLPSSLDLKRLATDYVRQVKAVQPHGPYHFVGGSIGAVIAYEMARQLSDQGEEIGLLFLLEPITPIKFIDDETIRLPLRTKYKWINGAIKATIRKLWPQPSVSPKRVPKLSKIKLITHTYLGRTLIFNGMQAMLNAESRPHSVFRQAYVTVLYEIGKWNYVARSFSGRATIFNVRKGSSVHIGIWKQILRGGVELFEMDLTYHTAIFATENVHMWLPELKSQLERSGDPRSK